MIARGDLLRDAKTLRATAIVHDGSTHSPQAGGNSSCRRRRLFTLDGRRRGGHARRPEAIPGSRLRPGGRCPQRAHREADRRWHHRRVRQRGRCGELRAFNPTRRRFPAGSQPIPARHCAPHRHQSRRCHHGRRRHLRRRRQYRRTPGAARRARRHLHLFDRQREHRQSDRRPFPRRR